MLHLPFQDRLEAGRALAAELALRKLNDNAVVIALTRGGVPVGFEVADRLHLPLDTVVVRKLGVPWQPELAMGAIAGDVRVLDRRMIRELRISGPEVEEVIERGKRRCISAKTSFGRTNRRWTLVAGRQS